MSEVQDDSVQTPDESNVKAELERKLGNANSKIDNLAQQNEIISSQIAALLKATEQSSASQAQNDDLDDLMFSDPKRYAEIIKQQVLNEVSQQQNQVSAIQAEKNRELQALSVDFPEIQDAGHQLTQEAIKVFESLPESQQNASIGYRIAVQQAALQLGIRPKSQRSEQNSEDFVLGRGSKSSKRSKKDDEISEGTKMFAQAMGLNIEDEKVMASLKQKAKRVNWKRYE